MQPGHDTSQALARWVEAGMPQLVLAVPRLPRCGERTVLQNGKVESINEPLKRGQG